ncbi:hypothetical protein [Belnapia rosea]|uniref:Lipoprotein n=1 Tax=Belnapia rosea TaxID=938405 RepID=A0A1G6P9E9_9PROT|nr:hypothetical protein [Belnapia rosea]SDB53688.1 hypothetical protein SAMN02927895_02008 [Belnapia rosea]SDC75985.1 hypothetical protein SAMN04487779_1002290 [Belnapia rosea]
MRFCKLLLLLPLLLAGCGDLPQPYRGRPGAQAQRLAVPLAIRLAVLPPSEALMTDEAAKGLAEAMATALQAEDVPAIATPTPLPLDWRVEIAAERQGQSVQPRFRLLNADGEVQAATQGNPVPIIRWAEPTPELFTEVASQAVPNLSRLLLQVEAARKSTDPQSLAAGPPRIRFTGVKGATGDGNTALATRMREFLGNEGFVVQDAADGASYALEGDVVLAPGGTPRQQRVEIQWIVSRRDGEELGRVVQINEVPTGRLRGLWGDIAYAAAEQAAPGVRTVVANAMSTPPPTASPGPAATPVAEEAPPLMPAARR